MPQDRRHKDNSGRRHPRVSCRGRFRKSTKKCLFSAELPFACWPESPAPRGRAPLSRPAERARGRATQARLFRSARAGEEDARSAAGAHGEERLMGSAVVARRIRGCAQRLGTGARWCGWCVGTLHRAFAGRLGRSMEGTCPAWRGAMAASRNRKLRQAVLGEASAVPGAGDGRRRVRRTRGRPGGGDRSAGASPPVHSAARDRAQPGTAPPAEPRPSPPGPGPSDAHPVAPPSAWPAAPPECGQFTLRRTGSVPQPKPPRPSKIEAPLGHTPPPPPPPDQPLANPISRAAIIAA